MSFDDDMRKLRDESNDPTFRAWVDWHRTYRVEKDLRWRADGSARYVGQRFFLRGSDKEVSESKAMETYQATSQEGPTR